MQEFASPLELLSDKRSRLSELARSAGRGTHERLLEIASQRQEQID